MTEEEKKAIERIEDIIYKRDETNYADDREITLYEDDIQKISKLLNLIDKQKEEIDYYKKQNEIKGKLLNKSLNETRKHCISKDKIRDKIKELEENIKVYNENSYYDPFYNTDYVARIKAQIIILKSLLKEGEPDAK